MKTRFMIFKLSQMVKVGAPIYHQITPLDSEPPPPPLEILPTPYHDPSIIDKMDELGKRVIQDNANLKEDVMRITKIMTK